MAFYLISAKTTSGVGLASVQIDGVNQEEPIVDELALVAAVKEFLLTIPNVGQTVAYKYEQVTTLV